MPGRDTSTEPHGSEPRRRGELALVALLFLASGFSALLYQVLWQRILGIFSGVHIYSITLIVTAFMAGLGCGGLFGGRFADRLAGRRALLAFAACELGIGLFGLVSPWVYYDLAYLRLGFAVRYPLALPLVHFVLLLLPTFLMGASLPLLARGLVRHRDAAARAIGVLYGVNALGAALGALCTAWYLIGALGFVGTIRLGALVNVLVALGTLQLCRRPPIDEPAGIGAREAPRDEAGSPAVSFGLGAWCLLYGLSGFIALSLELVWFRVLDVAIKSSPYTFGHLLGVFLGCLGLGGVAGALWFSRWKRAASAFLWGQWAISLSAGLALLALSSSTTDWLGKLQAYWSDPANALEMVDLVAALQGRGEPGVLAFAAELYFALPLLLIGAPTFLMGVTFAWIQRAVQTDVRAVGWRVGAIQSSNIAGSILGSLLTGALFLGWVGTPGTAALLVASGALFALLASLRMPRRAAPLVAVATVAASLSLAAGLPGAVRFWARLHGDAAQTLVVAEDASGVAALQPLTRGQWSLRVNGRMHSALPFGSIHKVLGMFPGLIHPRIEEALVIGLGSGATAWAVASAPNLRRMDLYEIVEPELAVLREWRKRGNVYRPLDRLLEDERVHLTFADGRLALRTEPRRYDLIEADALEPSMACSGNLYSREFFELCRSRLKPGGILLTYVPTARTRRTLLSVFPYALDFHAPRFASFMIASDHPIEFDRAAVLAALRDERMVRYLTESGEFPGSLALIEGYLAAATVTPVHAANRARFVAGDLNLDLFPRDEYDKSYDARYE